MFRNDDVYDIRLGVDHAGASTMALREDQAGEYMGTCDWQIDGKVPFDFMVHAKFACAEILK